MQDAVRANRLLANKKKAVASQVPPGQAIPYVDSIGGVYDKIKLPAAAPTALPAPTLPEMVNIFEGSPDVKVPVWRRYSPVANVAESHAVLVKDAQSGLSSISGLLARLHGKRLVDQEWVMTKMKKASPFLSALPFSATFISFWMSRLSMPTANMLKCCSRRRQSLKAAPSLCTSQLEHCLRTQSTRD